ncbi:glycosyltransferase family 2 protein [Carnimonas bestiolae]|uniref:glycosyltransferase family 2 protein n=1 Tax=Carnimonas bestiolae TaxID=3402172 RepID=UPI003EDC36A9
MNTNPLVSVVIPTFRRKEGVKRAIESALNQSYPSIEVVVVDDNEDDDYSLFIKQICASCASHRLRLYKRRQNGGGARARNSGILRARGEFVAFLDDDDVMLPDKIEKQINLLQQQGADVCSCDMLERFVTDGVLSPVKREKLIKGTIGQDEYFIAKNAAYTSMFLIRRTALIAVHGFSNTRKYQDKILMLKLYIKGFSIVAVDETLVVMTSHMGERITSKRTDLQSELAKCRYYDLAARRVSADAVYNIGILTASIRSRVLSQQGKYLASLALNMKTLFRVRSSCHWRIVAKAFKRNLLLYHSAI